MQTLSRLLAAATAASVAGMGVLAAPSTATTPTAAASAAAMSASDRGPVDLTSVTVHNSAKSLRLTFDYRRTGPRATPAHPLPYWWGATIYIDTDPRTKLPDYAAFLTNQCGSMYEIGKVVLKRNKYTGDRYLTVTKRWRGGCARSHKCLPTAKVAYAADRESVRAISFRRKAGCFDARRVRVSAQFRTGPYQMQLPSYDKVDLFPRASMTAYTPWTSPKQTHVFKDHSAGFTRMSPTQAP